MEKTEEIYKGFKGDLWKKEINVSDFIDNNYKEYKGDDSFLVGTTKKTDKVWEKCEKLLALERKKGLLDVDLEHFSGINTIPAGYIDKKNEVIFGLQSDKPLKRLVNPFGGVRMVKNALGAYGKEMNDQMKFIFDNRIRKTHNDGVFDAYSQDIRRARSAGLLTGLPDAYGRGRIIGDYRRVALYGIDRLIEEKQNELNTAPYLEITDEESIRLREEVSEQIRALNAMKEMAASYGFDISLPAKNAQEAFQWTYFAYLAAVKENNGAAMSLGRVSTFLDIYIERDIKNGTLTEELAQELVDQFTIKLRLVRHLRTPEYDEVFGGDPTWVTESIGGMLNEKKSLVTKNSFRFLHSLINLKPSPEPNLTVLWSKGLPEKFKRYCAKISILTDSIQYENDDVMSPIYGHDYAIACCVSAMKVGKQMQFFGARCNLAKALLYSINEGVDEKSCKKVLDGVKKLSTQTLNYKEVKENYFKVLDSVAKIYVNAMNVIHFMHDKYAYEASQMALHDTKVERLMAFGMAGLSVVADSLSAIKYAKVKPIRNENGLAVDFEVKGDFPKYGNDDDRVDEIAVEVVKHFIAALKKHKLYRNAEHTLSALTITSNVMYGKKTGNTPDGRKAGEPFAPGANPMHGRDSCGALASLNSVAKIPYACCCQDGVSNTFSIIPKALGYDENSRIKNLVSILDGYFVQGAQHINVNVLDREKLIDAMNNPDKYPTLTIRVSGYAVNFNKLSRAHQEEVIKRTFHEKI
ncbi:MAG TPA: formate C-acetyltransferase [Candidatus Caccopulliclostridium gallistercoris]|uniref:Formate acetyltransferase n=1 Tax=Candidatus Caccopulliclostridium gallistercoris TaxID=2840719 RepID=A0A9D1NFB7_9FIRM|nr:formate C-acetyltransferase [Candidatus Caccopulliclostridium gallistercoris]